MGRRRKELRGFGESFDGATGGRRAERAARIDCTEEWEQCGKVRRGKGARKNGDVVDKNEGGSGDLREGLGIAAQTGAERDEEFVCVFEG